MPKIELPLFLFFKQLEAYDRQKKHRALGMDSYFQFLEVIGQGYGLQSKEELYWICKMLWFKPYHEPKQFRQLFDNYFIDLATALNTAKQESDVASKNDSAKNIADTRNTLNPPPEEVKKEEEKKKKIVSPSG